MTQDLAALSHALLDAARKAGAEAADTLAIAGSAIEIDVREGVLEQAERSESTDIGLPRDQTPNPEGSNPQP